MRVGIDPCAAAYECGCAWPERVQRVRTALRARATWAGSIMLHYTRGRYIMGMLHVLQP